MLCHLTVRHPWVLRHGAIAASCVSRRFRPSVRASAPGVLAAGVEPSVYRDLRPGGEA
jgi:hypothetical protein